MRSWHNSLASSHLSQEEREEIVSLMEHMGSLGFNTSVDYGKHMADFHNRFQQELLGRKNRNTGPVRDALDELKDVRDEPLNSNSSSSRSRTRDLSVR